MPGALEVTEGTQEQTSGEAIVWAINTTNFATTPAGPTVKAVRLDTGDDVTSLVFPTGSAVANSAVITLPALRNLKPGKTYRIQVKFTSGGNTYEPYFQVKAVF